MSRWRTAAMLAALALAAACAPQEEATTQPPPTGDACTKENLPLVTAGKFTAGTDKPAYAPWFVDDDPANGKGYESAVTYAVAERLGFEAADVTWIVVPFTSAYAPGEKSFDVDINQVSITDERRKAVDFSTGYYDVTQTVITTKGSKIDGASSIAELAEAKLGAQVGTTSYKAITEQIKPTRQPAVFDTNDLAVQALQNQQVDGIVVDLPTAFFMTAAQLDDGVIVGQLPAGTGTSEQFGFILSKGSGLTGCVSAAVDQLREDGTLKRLEQEWLADTGGAPLLS